MLPSDERLAAWALESLVDLEWAPVEQAILKGLQTHWGGHSLEECASLAEERLPYVIEFVRNKVATSKASGHFFPYEADADEDYIRRITPSRASDLGRLRLIEPTAFEHLCSAVVSQLGATCSVTKKSNDGGVDFYATDVRFVREAAPFPAYCKITVIGQAKRYAATNLVNLNELRQFVGAATRFVSDLKAKSVVSDLSPIIFAFWTTSDFHSSAADYARRIGLWTVSGEAFLALAETYCVDCFSSADQPEDSITRGG